MSDRFFEKPILNSPYEYPTRHWKLDENGQPTQEIVEERRPADFVTPIPKPKRRRGKQLELDAATQHGFEDEMVVAEGGQRYDTKSNINFIRGQVDRWRDEPDPNKWHVTPETQRLLQHWRSHQFASIRPFFCQVEAAETAIWLTEVAPKLGKESKYYLDQLKDANKDANPEIYRIALKLATGAGKTMVMAMLIAWQTVNAVRRPNSKNFTKGFLLVAPGITIRDRLRVLLPNDPDSYYKSRELVPRDMMLDLERAKIVITNYHAFKLRETMPLSTGGRRLLEGRTGDEIKTKESEGQMLQRVMPELMGMKNILAINDEAHHCYSEKPGDSEEDKLKGEDRKEAEKNTEAARLWISGLESVGRKIGLQRVIDLSATPFFLNGSGYREGTLFPWTVSDFSLMDAIECGIVKLPRVPIDDNIPGDEMPMYRNLWEHIGKDMPKKGRGSAATLDPENLPIKLKTALESLYGHYEKTFEKWEQEGLPIPPCFIVVCNNTSTSKLVYDYLSGYERDSGSFKAGEHRLFWNFNEHGERLPKPRTLLIDSQQLESGDALDRDFRKIMAPEIDRFRREIIERTGSREKADKISDQDLLREVMNTVGKEGRLGESIRCVVSVSMLTEGWDANTVTHVLGIRAFGTQLLCEQVVGRALRRQSYEINETGEGKGLFNVEYADVLGIPFDFNAKPVIAPPQKPRHTIHVHAVSPERDHLEIEFPIVSGYRAELPEDKVEAEFTEESHLVLTPKLIGASQTTNQGIIGKAVDLDLKHTESMRKSTILFHLAKYLVETRYRDPNGDPKMYLFGQLKRVAREWLDGYFTCKGGTTRAQLCFRDIADLACEKITAAITLKSLDERPMVAILDPYNSRGSTSHVSFRTSKELRYESAPHLSHVNWVIGDSTWEIAFCSVIESHPKVKSYVKNHSLGFEVPYRFMAEAKRYRPDFIICVDDGHGPDDLLNLIVEIKGYRDEDAKVKKETMDVYWIPGVNHLKSFGRWAFAEFRDVWTFGEDFDEAILTSGFSKLIDQTLEAQATAPNR